MIDSYSNITEPFILYKSSAGSGKTHTLTVEYLKLALRYDEYYKRILAVTFTNKATRELKERVLNSLYAASTGNFNDLTESVRKGLELSEKDFRKKADKMLKGLLHEYSGFNILTIDSFFQKILRSFTREEGIHGNYKIELDDQEVLEKAIDKVYERVGKDEFVSKWLLKMSIENIDQGRSWDPRHGLSMLGKIMFKEEFKKLRKNPGKEPAGNPEEVQKEFYKICGLFEKKTTEIGEKALKIMESQGLHPNDFYRGKTGVGNLFQLLSQGTVKSPNSWTDKAFEEDIWYAQSSTRKDAIESAVDSGLSTLLDEYYKLLNGEEGYIYRSVLEVQKNFQSTVLTGEIIKELTNYLRENEKFLLSDSGLFLQNIISDSETPFIYEKTGSWFKHYLIDEFQDTSKLQWANFLPLIKDTLDSGTISMVVGDVKQSIYRFRGSDWSLLKSGVSRDLGNGNVYVKDLKINYRSSPNVIKFNNAFFTKAVELYFQHNPVDEDVKSEILEIYNDAEQKTKEEYEHEGFVSIDVMDKEDEEDDLTKKVSWTINKIVDLQKRGLKAGDIAVLVRNNKEIQPLVEGLNAFEATEDSKDHNLKVVSDELMEINNSLTVTFIVNVLRYLDNDRDSISLANILSDYNTYFTEVEEFIPHNIEMDSILDELPKGFKSLVEKKDYLSVVTLVDEIIDIFELNKIKGELNFILGFQDLILEYFDSGTGDIFSFLEWWNNKKPSYISIGDIPDAIKIMTIHKAKGLQFGAVILPFADWKPEDLRGRILVNSKIPPFDQLEFISLNLNSQLGDTLFFKEYKQELLNTLVDNFNILYVAMTRAVHELHVLVEEPGKNKKITTTGNLIYSYCENLMEEFSIGTPEVYNKEKENNKESNFVFDDYTVVNDPGRLKISSREMLSLNEEKVKSVTYGVIAHEILADLREINDLEDTIFRYQKIYSFGDDIKLEISKDLKNIFDDELVKGWFEMDSYNEISLSDERGDTLRPDKVVFSENEISVIDFKTGEVEARHKSQVKKYKKAIQEISGFKTKGYLLYTSPFKIEEV